MSNKVLFPLFKKVKIGTHKNVDLLREDIRKAGFYIDHTALDILKETPLSDSIEVLNLVIVSVEELGFTGEDEPNDIIEAGIHKGLGLCSAEVGPQLRLQYPEQPCGYWVAVAMKPIPSTEDIGWEYIFRLGHNASGRSPLTGREDRYVFVQP